jgi:hypothetical protein
MEESQYTYVKNQEVEENQRRNGRSRKNVVAFVDEDLLGLEIKRTPQLIASI